MVHLMLNHLKRIEKKIFQIIEQVQNNVNFYVFVIEIPIYSFGKEKSNFNSIKRIFKNQL